MGLGERDGLILTRPLICDVLPSLSELTTGLEHRSGQTLGEIVGLLLVCVNLYNGDPELRIIYN